jgi:hypothetical protein
MPQCVKDYRPRILLALKPEARANYGRTVAQLRAPFHDIEEVGGSIPSRSTNFHPIHGLISIWVPSGTVFQISSIS